MRRVLVGLLAAVGLITLLVAWTPVAFWWTTALADPWQDGAGDVLIVLTADDGGAGLLGYSTYLRGVYAVLAWREQHYSKIVVSGRDAGEALVRFLLAEGVPADVVVREGASGSTRENAENVAAMMKGDGRRKVLLTSDFHMYRAWRCFRKTGLEVRALPIPDGRKRAQWWLGRMEAAWTDVLETASIGVYLWRGWI